MKKFLLVAAAILISTVTSFAKDIKLDPGLTQDMFKSATKELGVALAFNPMSPAEPLGITGFDAAAEVIVTEINDDKDYWKLTFKNGDTIPTIPTARIHLQKGLPFNIDVGAMYSSVPSTDIKLWGVEVKYAILEGGITMPAISIRGAFSKLEGIDEIDVNTYSGDLMISKGFLFLTPYAGITMLRVNASENSDLVTLDDVHETIYRGLLGLQVSPLPLLNITVEASIGEVKQYGLKLGLRF
ncbi:MAG: hypothetical protein JG767_317 [Deferribacteraceae bacterium]|jgi:hypothetical protein|nr:hypothetical protein [Deferribacteraceae bacterium]